jgi:hypothetical protein
MTLQPFTPDGVAAKKNELYALTDAALQEQATLIKSNLVAWVNNNFTLRTDQSTYLSNIDRRWITYNADLISFGVSNKLSIILITNGDPSSLKLIHTQNDVVATSNGSAFSAAGSITLQVAYS